MLGNETPLSIAIRRWLSTHPDAARERELELLGLSRKHLLKELETITHPRLRELKERAAGKDPAARFVFGATWKPGGVRQSGDAAWHRVRVAIQVLGIETINRKPNEDAAIRYAII